MYLWSKFMYSRLPHNSYRSVDCPGYGVSGSMGFKKWPNKGQTNKILCKNPEEGQKTDTLHVAAIDNT